MKRILSSARLWGGLVAALAIACVSVAIQLQRPASNLYEDVSYALHPSAPRAFEIGERHFNGQDPSAYNVVRAATYFKKAVALDSHLLYVHHELARIYFLRGDFGNAMTQIDVQIAEHGDATPNSYYVRGLIEGYMGAYADAAKDYEQFLRSDPHNWAGINDYAWVLLKDGRAKDAARVTEAGLKDFPNNPWLLNSNSIALFELGRLKEANAQAKKAWGALQGVSEKEWLHSYPGNDPKVAQQGIETFRTSVQENMHRIERALASSTLQ